MLDDIIELILDIVLSIIVEVLGEKQASKGVQIVFGIILLAVLFSMCGVVIGIGIRDAKPVPIVVGTAMTLVFIGIIAVLVKKHKREKGI